MLFLVGDDADGPPADAGVAAEKRFAVFDAVLLEDAAIHDAGDDFAHVVLLGWIAGEDAAQFAGGIQRIDRLGVAENWRIGRSYFVDQSADAFETGFVVRLAEVHGAADLGMHFRAT